MPRDVIRSLWRRNSSVYKDRHDLEAMFDRRHIFFGKSLLLTLWCKLSDDTSKMCWNMFIMIKSLSISCTRNLLWHVRGGRVTDIMVLVSFESYQICIMHDEWFDLLIDKTYFFSFDFLRLSNNTVTCPTMITSAVWKGAQLSSMDNVSSLTNKEMIHLLSHDITSNEITWILFAYLNSGVMNFHEKEVYLWHVLVI